MTTITQSIALILVISVFLSKHTYCDDAFEEFVEYVTDYINYTEYYTFPENNADLVNVNNSEVIDYGSFDFIIVGAGAAGTVLARRLTEVTGWTILLLDAGKDTNAFTDIPFMNLYTRNSEYNWGYQTVAQNNSCLGMVDQKCVYPIGRGLGGTAIIGDSVYARGNKLDFDGWADLGLDGWGYDDMLPYLKKTERMDVHIDDIDEYHGTSGLMPINYTYPLSSTHYEFLDANLLAGLNTTDYNGANQIGIGNFQWTIDFNKKATGGNCIISPIISNTTNLNVTLQAFVTEILFSTDSDETKAVGVQFIKDGTVYTATATKEVILSAGAVNSPQLLMLSGIGPKEDLENLDIEVIQDLPVGKNLTDHPVYVGLYIRTNLTTDAGNVSYYLKRWEEGLGYYTTVFSADNIGFINTKDPGVEPPNVEFLTINPPTSVPPATFYNLNENYTNVFDTFDTLTDMLVYCINLEPKSRGWIKLASNSPTDFPLINPAYYTDDNNEDIEVMYECIQYITNLTTLEPLQAIDATVVSEAPDCDYLKETSEKDYWYCAIRSLTSTLYHPSCTTKMGTDSSESVVDINMKVHGISGLRVVDAGSMPILVRGHPLAAIWAMAEKISDAIKTEYDES